MLRSMALMLMSLGISIQSYAAGITYSISYSEKDFEFSQGNGYDIVSHKDCSLYEYGNLGSPQVLVQYLSFIIPVGESVQSITVNNSITHSFPGTYELIPVQSICYYCDCCDSIPEWTEPDSQYYNSNEPYPENIVVFDRCGYFDGANNIAIVEVFPVFYRALNGELFYYSSIDFTVNTGGSSIETPTFVQNRMRVDQVAYDGVLFNSVSNPEDIQTYGYVPPLSDTSIAMDVPEYRVFPYLIVTRDSLVQYWRLFVDWLNRKGKRAGIVTIEEIVGCVMVDDPQINDDSDLLRGYLKYAHERGVVWVLLGGVCEPVVNPNIGDDGINVPLRYYLGERSYSENDPPGPELSYNTNRPTDIYFSELNTDWERDGDGIPGEFMRPVDGGDGLSYNLNPFQELYVGRLPAIDGGDIDRWVNKVLNYEQNPGNGNYNYLSTAYWNAADQFQANGQIYMNQERFPLFFSHEVQEEIPTPDDDHPSNPLAHEVIDVMSMYPAFVNWHHHGSFKLGAVRSEGMHEHTVSKVCSSTEHGEDCCQGDLYCHMEDLENTDKPGFLFSVACEQAGFDFPYRVHIRQRCLGCNYVMTDNGGTGFIGTSRYSLVSRYSNATAKNDFLDFVFGNVPDPCPDYEYRYEINPGMAFMNIHHPSVIYLTNWLLFGSPEQEIWSDAPEHFVVEPEYGNDRVRVLSGGNPVRALVCFCSRDLSRYYIKRTDVNGYAQIGPEYDFDIGPETNITVTKHNHIPYQIIGGGEIQFDMEWRGDIAFYDDVEVPAGRSLVIKPGATIRTVSELGVFGNLVIEGSASEHVVLSSAEDIPAAGDWTGVKIETGGSADISYCEIEYASNAIQATSPGSFEISNSFIRNWVTYGVHVSNAIQPTVELCEFSEGGLKAVDVIGGDPIISSNKISGTDFAITYQGNGKPWIEANMLAGLLGSQYGIRVTRYQVGDTPAPHIVNNIDTLYNYGMELFYCHDDPAIVVKGNKVNRHKVGGLVLNDNTHIVGGSYVSGEYNQFSDNGEWGIYVGSGTPVIRENSIKRNGKYGVRAVLSGNPNLGDYATPGNNSLWGYVYDGYNTTLSNIMAVGNWWNITGNPNVYGSWDTSNPLPYDPYLWAKPEAEIAEIPREFKLGVNYPNPFNPTTIISVELPKPQNVRMQVFNVLGQKVRTLVNSTLAAGIHSVSWDGRDDEGREVGSGIYLCSFVSEEYSGSRKMTLIK